MESARLTVTPDMAANLGWPKLKYAVIERERRWLIESFPAETIVSSEDIRDLYVADTRLRLRRATPRDGGPPMLRLSRKADVDACHRLITTIYMTREEFALFDELPGRVIEKTRHHLRAPDGAYDLSIDEFHGRHAGLRIAEVEFDDDAAMAAFTPPAFFGCEISADPAYRGGALAVR
jgi:CYTH domain-containing protein